MLRTRHFAVGTILCATFVSGARAAEPMVVESPDGKIRVKIGVRADGRPEYAIERDGQAVINASALGITVDDVDLGVKTTLGEAKRSKTNETYPIAGVKTTAVNQSNDISIPMKGGPNGTAWTLEVRVFNDGVGYRYRVPGTGERRVQREAGEWNVVPGCRMWWQGLARGKDYEERNRQGGPGDVPVGEMIAMPATLKLPNDAGYAMLTEANLVHYSDAALQCLAGDVFGVLLHNEPRGFTVNGEVVTPWRVTLVAPDLTTLVNTDVIRNLCPPPSAELAKADWIKPSRALWHWRVTGHPKLDQQKQWIDWTKEVGFETYLVDDGWRDWNGGGENAWTALKEIVDYGKQNGVAVWAWSHSRELDTAEKRRAYMMKAREIGLVGLKLDFMLPADAHWVTWYDETLRDAAEFHLMIDYHGCVKPTGRERTWPNELNREGIAGREQGKLNGLHDTSLPFLRYVQGHADYTPTEFRKAKMGGNSYAKELAQAVVYTSPLLCYSGDPRDYLKSDAIDVLKTIPATWDETIVLPGSAIGEVAGFARRKGDAWYVGVINGTKARTMPLSLSFLGDDSYFAVLLGDKEDREDAFDRQDKTLTKTVAVDMKLRSDGGFVARFTPMK